jgi:hypothetical protein
MEFKLYYSINVMSYIIRLYVIKVELIKIMEKKIHNNLMIK